MADYPNLTDPNVSTGDWVLTLILSGIPDGVHIMV